MKYYQLTENLRVTYSPNGTAGPLFYKRNEDVFGSVYWQYDTTDNAYKYDLVLKALIKEAEDESNNLQEGKWIICLSKTQRTFRPQWLRHLFRCSLGGHENQGCTMPHRFVHVRAVKEYIKSKGKQSNTEFIDELQRKVQRLLDDACLAPNAGKKTLNRSVAVYTWGK